MNAVKRCLLALAAVGLIAAECQAQSYDFKDMTGRRPSSSHNPYPGMSMPSTRTPRVNYPRTPSMDRPASTGGYHGLMPRPRPYRY